MEALSGWIVVSTQSEHDAEKNESGWIALVRLLIVCGCLCFSLAVSLVLVMTTYGQLPPGAPVPISYAVFLGLSIVPGIAAIWYVWTLLQRRLFTKKLCPFLLPYVDDLEIWIFLNYPILTYYLGIVRNDYPYETSRKSKYHKMACGLCLQLGKPYRSYEDAKCSMYKNPDTSKIDEENKAE